MSHDMRAHERGEVSSCAGCEREEYERVREEREYERWAFEQYVEEQERLRASPEPQSQEGRAE